MVKLTTTFKIQKLISGRGSHLSQSRYGRTTILCRTIFLLLVVPFRVVCPSWLVVVRSWSVVIHCCRGRDVDIIKFEVFWIFTSFYPVSTKQLQSSTLAEKRTTFQTSNFILQILAADSSMVLLIADHFLPHDAADLTHIDPDQIRVDHSDMSTGGVIALTVFQEIFNLIICCFTAKVMVFGKFVNFRFLFFWRWTKFKTSKLSTKFLIAMLRVLGSGRLVSVLQPAVATTCLTAANISSAVSRVFELSIQMFMLAFVIWNSIRELTSERSGVETDGDAWRLGSSHFQHAWFLVCRTRGRNFCKFAN